ncbi:MAG: phage tail tube protein [Alloprevotella sp.]
MGIVLLKGRILRVKVGDKFIAAATECTLTHSASVNTVDTDHKDIDNTSPAYDEQEVKSLSWGVSVSAMASTVSAMTTHQGSMDLLDLVGKTVSIDFCSRSTGSLATVSTLYKGKAVCTDVKLTGQKDGVATYSAEFKGTGALTKSNVSQIES